jgi:hypothetical protein
MFFVVWRELYREPPVRWCTVENLDDKKTFDGFNGCSSHRGACTAATSNDAISINYANMLLPCVKLIFY